MPVDHTDLFRLTGRPGLHGAHCTECDYLFDAYDTPTRLGDVTMLLKKLSSERGHTVIVVTHDNRIFHLADRMVFIEDGQIVPRPPH